MKRNDNDTFTMEGGHYFCYFCFISPFLINNNTVPAGGPGPRAFTCQMNFQVTVNVDYRLYFYTSFQTRFQIIHDQVVFPSE